MKKRLLSGIITALVLTTSFNPSIISYAENDPTNEIIVDEDKDKEEEEKKDEEIEDDGKEEQKDKDIKEYVVEELPDEYKIELSGLEKMLSESKLPFMAFSFVALPNEESHDDIIKEVKIYKKVEGRKEPLTGDGTDVVANDDIISVEYYFKDQLTIVPSETDDSGLVYDVVAGAEYPIPGIPGFCVDPDHKNITVKNSDDLSLGEVIFDDDGTAKFVVNNSFDEATVASRAMFEYDFQINSSDIDNGGNESFELVLGGTKITLRLADNMPKEPEVIKTASDVDENGDITWTVTVTNNVKPIEYDDGYIFTDTFGNGQSFVSGSFRVNDAIDDNVELTESNNSISWEYTDNASGSVNKFEYKTHVDILALTKDVNQPKTVTKKVSNSISVTASNETYGDLNVQKTEEVTVNKSISEWITKTGEEVNESGESIWTVFIKNNGFTLKDVVLHDMITADNLTTITVEDISVVDKDGNNVIYNFVPGGVGRESQFIFSGTMAGDEVYRVTYKTKIEGFERYLKENHTLPSNKAWVSYKYDPTGTGNGLTEVIGPTVVKEFKGVHSKAAIEKKAAGIDVANHTMTWEIVANKSSQELNSVKITDILPKGHAYEGIENVTVGGNDFEVTSDKIRFGENANGNKTVTIDFGNIDQEEIKFNIITELDASQSFVWAGNKSMRYTNEVKMESSGNDIVSDTAYQTYTSKVLEKTAGNYNYNDRTINYIITVNDNEMVLNDVVITDQLEDKLTLVDGSLSITDNNDVSLEYVDESVGQNLVYKLNHIEGKVFIKFKCKVIDGEHFSLTGDINIENSASITSNEYSSPVNTASRITTIDNTVLSKEAVISTTDKGRVNYTVTLNPARQQLYTGNVNTVAIKDTLGSSLVLDGASVELYTGDVAIGDGKITKNSKIDNAETHIAAEGNKTVLLVDIPRGYDKNAFVLTYSADVADLDANDLSNEVQLVGYGESDQNNANQSFEKSKFSNVSFSKFTYVIADLKDEFDESVLEGGKFKLVDAASEAVVGEKTTGTNGKLTFVGKLQEHHEYKLYETEAPDGYLIPEALAEGITITTQGAGLEVAKQNATTLYNKQPSVTLTIGDVSKEANMTLSGAKFKLYKRNSNTPLKSWESENAPKQLEIPKGSYVLERTKQPNGYEAGDRKISFEVIDENAGISNVQPSLKLALAQESTSENVLIDLTSSKILVQEIKATSGDDTTGNDSDNNSGLPQLGMPGRGPLSNGGTGNGTVGAIDDGTTQPGNSGDGSKERGNHVSNDHGDDHGTSSEKNDNPQNFSGVEYDNAVQTVNIVAPAEDTKSESSERPEISEGQEAKALSGARLRKTGGFIGTAIGYIAGIMLIIAGALLVSRKRKHV